MLRTKVDAAEGILRGINKNNSHLLTKNKISDFVHAGRQGVERIPANNLSVYGATKELQKNPGSIHAKINLKAAKKR